MAIHDRNDHVQIKTLHEERRLTEENDRVSRLLRPYASFLVKYPGIAVVIVILAVIFSAILGLVPAAGAKDLPDFSNPTKGFSARGTIISSRRTSEELLINQIFQQTSSTRFSSANGRRKRRDINSDDFNFHEKLNARFVFIFKHVQENGNLIESITALLSICNWYKQNVIQADINNILNFNTHHLPNYIALLSNRSSCSVITDKDLKTFITLLNDCKEFYINNKYRLCKEDESKCKEITNLSCLSQRTIYSSGSKTHQQIMSTFMYNIFYYLTDEEFVNNPNYLQYTSVFHSIDMYVDANNFFENIYDKHLKDLSKSKYNNIEVAGFQFDNFKFHIFQSKIIEQSLFIVSAIIVVILLIWFYTNSVFIGLMTIACVLIATIITYFVYGRIFNMNFFPFLNMVTTIFMVGIGADDAFVYTGIWQEAKEIYALRSPAHHVEYMTKWTIHALRHASLSMLVTSLTTAAAFYSNMSSNVTSVKCFGLYSGTAIIVMFLLMITFFPVVVVLHEKYLARCMHFICPGCCNSRPVISDHEDLHPIEMNSVGQTTHEEQPKHILKRTQTFVDKISDGIFKYYLPIIIIKLRYFWVLFFLAIGVGGVVITFIDPALRPPSTGEFQMFASSNSLEQYDLKYKKKFRFGLSSSGGNRHVSFIFGVKDIDNGYKFDPDALGTLEFHQDKIDIAKQQIWLRDFCVNLKNATFYINSRACEEFLSLVTKFTTSCQKAQDVCCNRTLPLQSDVFVSCIKAATATAAMTSKLWMLDNNENFRAVFISAETTYQQTDSYDENELLFNEMDKWFQKQNLTVLSDDFKGFWHVEQIFYDLQLTLSKGTKESLAISIAVALVVIFITSWNIVLSLYSIITITFIISVTVGILILAGWRLNIMESVVFSVAAGLSADFTLHYSVAYKVSLLKNDRVERVKSSLLEIGPAIMMGAATTFVSGVAMVPSSVLVYIQMAQFLMLVMFVSWLISTLFFLPLCATIGPVKNFGELKCLDRKSERIDNIENSNRLKHNNDLTNNEPMKEENTNPSEQEEYKTPQLK